MNVCRINSYLHLIRKEPFDIQVIRNPGTVFVWFEVEEVVMVPEKKPVNILCNQVAQTDFIQEAIAVTKDQPDPLLNFL